MHAYVDLLKIAVLQPFGKGRWGGGTQRAAGSATAKDYLPRKGAEGVSHATLAHSLPC